jgi:hypothetical protein
MSTIKDFIADGGVGAIPADGLNKAVVLKSRVDFSEVSCLSGDVVQALRIPKNFLVLNVFVKVVTAEGGTCTATVGDGSDADGWDASANLNATAGTVTQGASGTDAYAAIANFGKLYTADDTIDLVLGNDADTAVVDIFAVGFDMN